MAAVNNWGVETYVKGDIEEYVPKVFAKQTGIYNAKIVEVTGSESQDGRTTFVTFEFLTNDGETIRCKELRTYTDKSTGEVTETKGSFMVKALIAFKAGEGKAKASTTWEKAVAKTRDGDEYTIHKLKGMENVEVVIYATQTRSVYEGRNGDVAKEEMKLTSIFNGDGKSLGEFEGEGEPLTKLNNAKKRLTDKLERGLTTTVYEKCDEEEWLDIKGEDADSTTTANATTAGNEDEDDIDDTSSDVSTDLPELDINSDEDGAVAGDEEEDDDDL